MNQILSISTCSIFFLAPVWALLSIPKSSSSSDALSCSDEELELSDPSSPVLSKNYIPPCPPFGPSFSFISKSWGTCPKALSCLISSGVYLRMISHFSFWNYLKLAMSKSPIPIHIFFLILPLMCPILSTSSKHLTKTLPLPSILRARPYYRPSSAYFIKRSLLTGPECFPFL